MNDGGAFRYCVRTEEAGRRLDVVLAARLNGPSRSAVAAAIRQGAVTVDGRVRKPGHTVRPGEIIRGALPQPARPDAVAEPIDLTILFEDDRLLVVDKPAGMVVHPSAGHFSGTLVNALLHHYPEIEVRRDGEILRPGIVHRLDKDTSGCLVIAKDSRTQQRLQEQFRARRIRKTYLALVVGRVAADAGRIDLPVGRHPRDRKKMSVFSHRGRPALTLWRVRRRFSCATLLELDLKTGRTHQIRVHLASLGHPVAGDPVYGGVRRLAATPLQAAGRQMLHAWRLSFSHPQGGTRMSVTAPLPPDMRQLLRTLADAGSNASGTR